MKGWFGAWLALVGGLAAVGCVVPAAPTPTALAEVTQLRQAIKNLAQAKSYRLAVTGANRVAIEGREWVWPFRGEGWSRGSDFYSMVVGPADSFLEVYIAGGQAKCRSTQGELDGPKCGSAFGGIGVGAAPYTAIAYLRSFEEASLRVVATSEGELRLGFHPNLAQVAALDESHRQAMPGVVVVAGEVTLDRKRALPLQETVWVDFRALPNDAIQRTTMTLEFYGFDEPLELGEPLP